MSEIGSDSELLRMSDTKTCVYGTLFAAETQGNFGIYCQIVNFVELEGLYSLSFEEHSLDSLMVFQGME